jgi:predicted nucleotidyltransferase
VTTINHGLNKFQLNTLRNILSPFKKQIESISLFGSRATGNYRPNSDIDIVIYGTIDAKTIDRIHTLLNDSNIPYKIDVQAYNLIDYTPLKNHIDTNMKVLFNKKDLS